MIKRLLCLVAALVVSLGAHAQTGSVKTQTQLNSEVNTLWPDNTSGQITPFNARQTLLDMVATQFSVGGVTAGSSTCSMCTSAGLLYSNGSLVLSSSVLGVGSAGLTINSANGVSFPSSDTTANGSLAVGPFSLAGQTSSGAYSNVAIGYQTIGGSLTTAAIQNTAVGFQAMALTTTGNANAAFGTGALLHNTSGAFNSAVGNGALGANTSGSENVALGASALGGNTTGGFNIGIGFVCCGGTQTGTFNIWMGEAAAPANTSGSSNIGIGQGVMAANTTGTGNLAVGNAALAGNTTNGSQFAMGSQAMQNFTGTSGVSDIRNTAVGHFTLQAMTVGGYNTALGFEAGLFIGGHGGTDCTGSCTGNTALGALANTYTTAGNFNTGVGYFALFGNNRADSPTFTANYAFNNTGVGANSLLAITNGGQNTAVGMNSLAGVTGVTGPPATDGGDNTAIGYNACALVTTGNQNICVGSKTSTNGTTGTGNIVIGYNLALTGATNSNELHIGNATDTITGDLSTKKVTVQGVMNVPTTTASAGQYQINSAAFMHNGGMVSDTFVGNTAGNFTLSGANNTCVGSSTCAQLTSGTQNTTTGAGNLAACTTCSFDTAMGYNALVTVTTAQQNSAFGFNSLVMNVTGGSNSAFGSATCQDITTGGNNTCIGINEGSGQTTGSNNTFVGNTTATGTTSTTTLATFAGTTSVTMGGNDTNLSLVAGMRVSSGGCIANGTTIASLSSTQGITLSQAAICNTSGQITFASSPYQTFNTSASGTGCFTTTNTSAVVTLSGTGSCTVALLGLLKGMRVTANMVNLTNGSTISSVDSNTQITMSVAATTGVGGGNATFQHPLGGNGCMTCANVVIIGRTLTGTVAYNASGVMVFADGAGNVRGDYGNTTASTWTFGANTAITGTVTVSAIALNTGAQTGYMCYNTTGGVITYDGTNTCLVSSQRFKEHILPFAPRDALDEAMRLVPSSFNRLAAYSPDTSPRLGLIAEQVAGVDERLIVRDADGLPRGVLYETGGVAIAIGAIQALKADNDNLRRRVDALESAAR